jgi:hypothetical protein
MSETSWPKKGNKAFVSAGEGKSFHLDRFRYPFPLKPEAFKIAAEMVIGQCHEADRFTYRDELFFPVAYLYRHGIELFLKDIITTGIHMHFFKRADVEEALANHNLAKLWNQAKKLLHDRWPTADQTPLKAVEAVVNEYHQADPNGQVFRYDEDKNGKRHRYETLPDHISLDTMRKTMDGVFSFLEATSGCLRDDLSNMLDAMSEYRE